MIGLRTAIVAGFATTAFLIAPALAQAAPGIVVENTPLFAGPDSQFPPVDQIPAGTNVDVNGCLTGYSWCDVSFQQDRGWISGQSLEILYQSRRVRIVEVTPDVVPYVAFEFNSYWQEHYHDRPFFQDRDRYAGINININITGDKGGGNGKDKVTNGGGVGGQATDGGKPATANGGGDKAKIVTKDNKKIVKDNKGAGAGAISAGKGAGAAVVKKGVTAPVVKKGPVVVKKGCKPGEKGCAKAPGNGNGN